MDFDSHAFSASPHDLDDPQTAIEALAHWDELDPTTLSRLAEHPVHGPRLAMLRAADTWLADQATAARAAREAGEARGSRATPSLRPAARAYRAAAEGDTFADAVQRAAAEDSHDVGLGCPRPEDLYDYGRGPGYTPLTAAARASIDRHLARCRHCELLVETLMAPPPAPLELDYDAAAAIGTEPVHAADGDRADRFDSDRESPAVRARPAFAAQPARESDAGHVARAAGEAAALHRVTGASARGHANGDAIQSPTAGSERRDRARTSPPRRWIPLAAAASLIAAAALWAALATSEKTPARFPESPLLRGATTGSLLFPREHVLRPTPEIVRIWPAFADRLTFEIEPAAKAQSYWIEVSKHDGSAFGTNASLWKQPSTAPTFPAQSDLAAGHYTWEAWAIVNGLDQHLGRRDFDIVDDAALCSQLAALAGRSPSERDLAAVCLLHERGYRTDARRIARQMPASSERDAYLAQVPGR